MMPPEQIELMFRAINRLETYKHKIEAACMPIHPDIIEAMEHLEELKVQIQTESSEGIARILGRK
jgi:hypothetical protein